MAVQPRSKILFGVDSLAAQPHLLNDFKRVALATNDAARSALDPELRSRAMLCSAGIPIVQLYSPEHGLNADAADGSAVADRADSLTGLPVISLYGERLAPDAATLGNVDAVLFDIPDVGARFYTYLWTLTHLVDACAAAAKPIYVLDRPNPLSADLARSEGPFLEERFLSFIGRASIPVRHSLTLGDLALLWRDEHAPEADVRVIRCDGWEREMMWSDTGLEFTPTSPAIRCFEAALLYPGLCFFEATNLSVGRGSAHAFQCVEADWLRAGDVVHRLAKRDLPGVTFHALGNAIHIGINEPRSVRPVSLGLALLAEVAAMHRKELRWTAYPTAVNPAGTEHLERLIGRGDVAARIRNDPESISDGVIADWVDAAGWTARVHACLRETNERPHSKLE